MKAAAKRFKALQLAIIGMVAVTLGLAAFADDDSRKTPEQFAALYLKTFNAADLDGLRKLRYPVQKQSGMQEMIDGITEATMKERKKFTKVEVLPLTGDINKKNLGPDGLMYKPNLTPTNLMKLSLSGAGESMTTTLPIGIKDGIYYEVGVEPDDSQASSYSFGWQRVSLPDTSWSVMMPNEAEPGKLALQADLGKGVSVTADDYGVVKNTADIKTTQHWVRCGEEGKRVNDADNTETYRAACTTFEPDTLTKWFSDPKKNISDAVDLASRQNQGRLLKSIDVTLNGAPGAAYEVTDSDGATRLGRVYWINSALYELSFVSKKSPPDKAGAEKFLTSLQVK